MGGGPLFYVVTGMLFRFHRGGPAGTSSARRWPAPSWGSPWTSTGGGLISGSPITTTSWLSPRYKQTESGCICSLESVAPVRLSGLLYTCCARVQLKRIRCVRSGCFPLTGFLPERLLGPILPAHWTPDDRRLQDVKVSEEFHHH